VVLLLAVVEQGSPRLFGYSRHRSGIRQVWQVVTAFCWVAVPRQYRETGDYRKSSLRPRFR
jgi:fucose permease